MTKITKRIDLSPTLQEEYSAKYVKFIISCHFQEYAGRDQLPYFSSNDLKILVNNRALWIHGADKHNDLLDYCYSQDKDIKNLVQLHLVDVEGYKMHHVSNTWYAIQQLREQLLYANKSKDEIVKEFEACVNRWLYDVKRKTKVGFAGYSLLFGRGTAGAHFKDKVLAAITENKTKPLTHGFTMYLNNPKLYKSCLTEWVDGKRYKLYNEVIDVNAPLGKAFNCPLWFLELARIADRYKTAKSKIEYRNIEDFSTKLNITLDTAKDLTLLNNEHELETYLKSNGIFSKNKLKLEELKAKYNIETKTN